MPHPAPYGILPAVITPFDAQERIDYAAWQKIIDQLIAAGVHGLFFAGGQGEFFSLTSTERRDVLQACVRMVRGRVPVYMGTGSVTTKESVALTQAAAEAGVDYAVVITPYYLKPNQDELAGHYLQICRESPLPVLAYNIPERTGVELAPDTVRRIAEGSERFVGLKDSSGDLVKLRQFLAAGQHTGRPFCVFVGRDHLILPAVRLGCVGAVAACANVIPELMVGLYDAQRRGDDALAERLQEQITPLRMAFSMGTFPVVIKEAMKIAGMPAGECRRPVGPLSEAERERLREIVLAARAAAQAVPRAMAGAAD
jgi:4-hydroxy-tetrahydrodipicolinate synthase